MNRVACSLPGTVGEWVQGWILPEGEALVSLVVQWRGQVRLRSGPDGAAKLPPKAYRALRLARERFSLGGVRVEMDNPLRPALGLGTSTMDVGGILAGAAVLAGQPLIPEDLFRLCCEIEPSDGTMFPRLALVDHLKGTLVETLPDPPDLHLAVLLPFRTLDTEAYRKDRAVMNAVRSRSARHVKAYRILKDGLLAGDARKVAAAATLSAILQQAVMPREEWPLLLGACRECRGLGIAVAHSGTASAVLFPDASGAECAARWFRSRWDLGEIACVPVSGGGVEVQEEPDPA